MQVGNLRMKEAKYVFIAFEISLKFLVWKTTLYINPMNGHFIRANLICIALVFKAMAYI